MKKLLIFITFVLSFIGCNKVQIEEPNKWNFNYPQNEICNYEWIGTHIMADNNGKWFAVDGLPSSYKFTIRFKKDFTYQSTGFIYSGVDKYEVEGNTIYTYALGLFFVKYEFESIINDIAEVTVTTFDGLSFKVKMKRV